MTEGTHTFWQFTINNYDATDLALINQAYPDHIRQIAFTLEEGELTGTPHVQAYVKLMRPQRLTFLRKLFPRAAHCKFLDSAEFQLNAKRYATKQDGTAVSPSVIVNNPFQDPVSELMHVARSVLHDFLPDRVNLGTLKFKGDVESAFKIIESTNVMEKPMLAKFYVSALYQKVKAEYWRQFLMHIQDSDRRESRVEIPTTHTHTHTGEIKSHANENAAQDGQGGGVFQGDDESGCEPDDSSVEDSISEASSDADESGGSLSGSSYDCSQ